MPAFSHTHSFFSFYLKSVFLIQNTKILPSKASITRKSLPFFNYFVKILTFQALRFSRFIRFISCVCICLRECVRVSIKRKLFVCYLFALCPFPLFLFIATITLRSNWPPSPLTAYYSKYRVNEPISNPCTYFQPQKGSKIGPTFRKQPLNRVNNPEIARVPIFALSCFQSQK